MSQSEVDFSERLSRVKSAAEAISGIENPELQSDAFHYLLFGQAHSAGESQNGDSLAEDPIEEEAVEVLPLDPSHPAAKSARKKGPGKKQFFETVRDLDFYHSDGPLKKSFAAFLDLHESKTQEHRVVAAVYWLKNELELPAVKIEHVYTAFKTMEWPVPADLANIIAKAGTKNFLVSKTRDDIKMTTHGDNLVEQVLKPKTAE